MSNKEVAIVIPLSIDHELKKTEKKSLKHLDHYLGEYDRFFLAPHDLDFSYNDYQIVRFDDRYFGSLKAHNMLCLSKELYDRFSEYKYLLMHHLDCLILNNDLEKFCQMDYDFIGPPWIKGPDLPWLGEEGVGNGGLSLRKVEAFQNLLDSKVPMDTFYEKIEKVIDSKSLKYKLKNSLYALTWFYAPLNNIHRHLDIYIRKGGNDDRFLYKFRKKYYPSFKTAPVNLALDFGFEANPRICFERNNFQLPFGCHAWEKYDRKFWESFVSDICLFN